MNIKMLVLIPCLLVAACSIKPYRYSQIVQDEDFIIAEILATGLVLGGVTSSTFNLDEKTRQEHTEHLEKFLSTYPIYGNYKNERLQKAINKQQYQRLIAQYDKTQSIPADLYEPLSEGLGYARYVMFAHIIQDNVSRFKSFPNEGLTFNTKRTMAVSLKIFNLREKKITQHTRISASKTSEARSIQLGVRSSAGTAISIGLSHALKGTYPDAPTQSEVLDVIFLGIKDQLPKK